MNNKNILDILKESAYELNLTQDNYDTGKIYNIVEFCNIFLELSKEDSIAYLIV